MSDKLNTASIRIPGKIRVDVTFPAGTDLRRAFQEAAAALGITEFDVESIVPVVNGKEADLQDTVPDGAQVDGTTNVANG
ncbi:MAG: hypothetical protein WBP14_04195 [Candidatus Saccharimonas aalborgensis]